MGTLNQLRDRVGKVNADNGFHEVPFNLGEKLMLINTELAECLEAHRIGHHSDIAGYKQRLHELDSSMNLDVIQPGQEDVIKITHFKETFKKYIKEGIEAEVIDALIRVFDLAYLLNIDMDTLFELIVKNNSLRGYRHGKQY